jgi:hypothetical protein
MLVSGNTDASGNFSLTYTHTSITNAGAKVYIRSPYFSFGIAVNQNDSQNFYNSTAGSMKIILHPLSPLNKGDTLFLGYPNPNNTIVIDTLFNTFSGVYKTIRSPVGPISFFYGRGWNKFNYNSVGGGHFTSTKNEIPARITGDPIVDSVTVNY